MKDRLEINKQAKEHFCSELLSILCGLDESTVDPAKYLQLFKYLRDTFDSDAVDMQILSTIHGKTLAYKVIECQVRKEKSAD